MFTVFAFSHTNTVNFEKSYLEWDYALQIFNTATKCKDCRSAFIIDATTGELIMDWSCVKGLVYPE